MFTATISMWKGKGKYSLQERWENNIHVYYSCVEGQRAG